MYLKNYLHVRIKVVISLKAEFEGNPLSSSCAILSLLIKSVSPLRI